MQYAHCSFCGLDSKCVQILDEYPKHGEILHYEVFSRHAHHLLNVLAAQLELLPDKLVLTNVIVAGTHPIASGGYSNIYRGQYQDHDGKEVQVALKVLKIFEDQLEEEQHRLHLKFAKEALVWYYLRHPNIVPFLGVDSTTFPSPSRAMVSPWMVQGSVLKYMARNSPVAPYAVQLLNDIISGLNYLHSVNIVHGDLCGRNILINEHGRASLTDFGLAGLIESEPTLRTTTRGGSLRWQPPELILPGVPFRRTMASDVWAFGCVCGEIWTEGTTPFSHFPTDSSIILGLQQAPTEQPYQTQPTDRQGTSMPDSLWDLVQRCWRYNVLERPMGNVMVDVLARITNRELPGHRHEDKGSLELLSLGGAGQAEGGQSLPLELSTSPTLPSRIVQGSVAKAMDKPLPAIPVDPQESLSDE
ncbi:kinase-like protein [Mycena filopes]|nr:kinase-like protein [Mycena filopes]